MFKLAIALLVLLPGAAHAADLQLEKHERTLAVVMTNDPKVNQIKIYDAKDRTLLQTLPTNGKGGAGNNARGVRQFNGELFAAVNKGSNSVAVFRRDRDRLRFDSLVYTTSAPVSIDFGNGHMYVAGTTTVDSFVVRHGHVDGLDGTTGLILANGTVPPDGATGQVGVAGERPSARHTQDRSRSGHRGRHRAQRWRHHHADRAGSSAIRPAHSRRLVLPCTRTAPR